MEWIKRLWEFAGCLPSYWQLTDSSELVGVNWLIVNNSQWLGNQHANSLSLLIDLTVFYVIYLKCPNIKSILMGRKNFAFPWCNPDKILEFLGWSGEKLKVLGCQGGCNGQMLHAILFGQFFIFSIHCLTYYLSSKLYNGGDHFLCLLLGQPQFAPDGHTLNVNKKVICVFTELSNKEKEKQVHLAVKALTGAVRNMRKRCMLQALKCWEQFWEIDHLLHYILHYRAVIWAHKGCQSFFIWTTV